MDINYVGLDKLIKTLSKVSTRIAFALLLSALIIGDSMIIAQPDDNTAYYIKVIGQWGFIATVVIAICFIFSFFMREDKH